MEITKNQTKKISYNNLIEYNMDNFLAISTGQPLLFWCDGYLLSFSRFNIDSFEENIIKHGNRCYDTIVYCKMPEFKPIVTDIHNNGFPVIDDSTNEIHKYVTDWLQTLD